MKRYVASLIIVFVAMLACAGGLRAQVGELVFGGTITSSNHIPLNGNKATDAPFHSQFIFPADSLTSIVDKLIYGFDFFTKDAAAQAFDSKYVVRIGSIEQNQFSSITFEDNVNFTKVYEGTLDATGDEMVITFDMPYDYRGGNMVVDITISEVGTITYPTKFRGSQRDGSSIMRCTGIAGKYDFIPRVRIHYQDIPSNTRTAVNNSTAELCYGSTGSYYDWHLSLEDGGGSTYNTMIMSVDLRKYTFEGSDTTVAVEHVMPRNLMGCADTERLSITIYRPLKHFVYDTLCQGPGTYTNYGLNIDLSTLYAGTKTYLTAESAWDRVYDVQCFDTTYLKLTINRTYKMSRNLNLCTSRISHDDAGAYYMLGNHRIDIPGTIGTDVIEFTDTIYGETTKGCDSNMVLHVKVSPSNRGDTTVYVRESELPYTALDVTFTYASTRTRMYTNQYGCDSIVTITLALKPTYRDTTYVTGCGEYTWTVMGTTVATIDHDTLASYLTTSSDNLDSVVYLRYKRGSMNRADTTVTACDIYSFKGVDYTASTNIYDTVAGIGMECDTQYSWHIRINHPIYRAETAEVCDSLIWNGTVYHTSTTDIYYYMANECENADTLHLSVIYSTIGDTLVYAPQSFIYYDTTFTESGDFEYVIENQVGCDSIVTLHLFVTPRGTPMPQLYAYENNVLILNHYPYGDNTRVDYDSIYWEINGAVVDGFHDDNYHLEDYAALSGCYKVWVLIEGVWFPTNEICFGNGIADIAGELDFNVWPNPVKRGEMVNIDVRSQEPVASGRWAAAIYDLEGRKVIEKTITSDNTAFSCNLEKGTYIMTLTDSSTGRTGKSKKIVVTY